MIISPTLPNDIEDTIVKAFNLEGLIAGHHRILNEKGEIIDRFRVDSITIVELRNYYLVPVTIALAHRYEWFNDFENDTQVGYTSLQRYITCPSDARTLGQKIQWRQPYPSYRDGVTYFTL